MSRWLTPEQSGPYAHLTTETLGLALAEITIPGSGAALHKEELVAAGITFAGLPAALVVGRLSSTRAGLVLLSLVVAEPFRRMGLATQLLHWLCAEARRLGWPSLSLSYPLGHASTGPMIRLTDSQLGWLRMPGLRLVHLDRTGGQALVERLEPLAAHWQRSGRFRLRRWQSLSPEQQHQLDILPTTPGWASTSQGRLDGPLGKHDGEISQVLFDNERPVGRLIAHRVGHSLFRVSQWWVEPALQGNGVSLVLLKQAIADALETQPRYRAGCFGVAAASGAMLVLCQRYLEPLASGIQANERVILQIHSTK